MGCTSCGSNISQTTPCPECGPPARPDIPDDIREAIDSILEYNWSNEVADYESCEDDPRGCHILEKLVLVNNWLHPDLPEELPEWRKPLWYEEGEGQAEEVVDAEG